MSNLRKISDIERHRIDYESILRGSCYETATPKDIGVRPSGVILWRPFVHVGCEETYEVAILGSHPIADDDTSLDELL